jgi:F-type H+-transporting ATPase subunit b
MVPSALTAQEEAHDTGGGAALFDVNLGLSLWTVVIFVALLVILKKFAWGPILGAAQAREERIQSALDEAAAQQAEAVRILGEHRAQLADARRQVQEIISDGKSAGERVRRDIEEKARAEAQRLVDQARAEIDRAKDEALDELRRGAVDLALAAAAKLLDQKMDAESDRDLVLGYVRDLDRSQQEAARA